MSSCDNNSSSDSGEEKKKLEMAESEKPFTTNIGYQFNRKMFVCVGGPMGVGKTTLCNSLVEKMGESALRMDEKLDENILNSFYEDKEGIFLGKKQCSRDGHLNTLFIQHWFLSEYVKRFRKVYQNPAGTFMISDRHLFENKIFAKINMKKSGKEIYDLYRDVYGEYEGSVLKPDLYIILCCDTNELVNRVVERGNDYEVNNMVGMIPYMKELNRSYTHELVNYCVNNNVPYILFDTNELSEEDLTNAALEAVVSYCCIQEKMHNILKISEQRNKGKGKEEKEEKEEEEQ